jgi:D-alanyl-D-alanine carboxypeptidase
MKRYLILWVFTLLWSSGTKAQDLQHSIQAKVDSLQRSHGFPGLTFHAILSDGTRVSLSTGTADSLSQEKMSTEHRMLSGSNGKTLFAASVLKLASEGRIHLDHKISQYLREEPWFHRLPNAETVTLRMLMNHTSGIEEYYSLGDFMELVKADPGRTFTPYETFKYILDRQPLFPAGTQWGYSDTNYILLGYIIEKFTGKSMYERVKAEILEPYALNFTQPSTQRSFERLATGYGRKNSPFPFHGAMVKQGHMVFNPQFEWMGGGFVSQVRDLATWAKTLYTLKEISPKMREEMRVAVPARTGKDHAYGLGIQIRPSERWGYSFGHSGWFPGYLTDAVYFPDIDLALAIQFNTDDISKLKAAPYTYLLLLAEEIIPK